MSGTFCLRSDLLPPGRAVGSFRCHRPFFVRAFGACVVAWESTGHTVTFIPPTTCFGRTEGRPKERPGGAPRHTVAVAMRMAGHSLQDIQAYRCHSSLHTTHSVYCIPDFQQLLCVMRLPWMDSKSMLQSRTLLLETLVPPPFRLRPSCGRRACLSHEALLPLAPLSGDLPPVGVVGAAPTRDTAAECWTDPRWPPASECPRTWHTD